MLPIKDVVSVSEGMCACDVVNQSLRKATTNTMPIRPMLAQSAMSPQTCTASPCTTSRRLQRGPDQRATEASMEVCMAVSGWQLLLAASHAGFRNRTSLTSTRRLTNSSNLPHLLSLSSRRSRTTPLLT